MTSDHMSASEGIQSNQAYQELPSGETSPESSALPSRPTSSGDNPAPKRSRVRFHSTNEANDATNQKSSVPLRDRSTSPQTITAPKQVKSSPSHSRNSSVTNLLRRTPETEKENPFADQILNPVFKPRPSLLRNNPSNYTEEPEKVDDFNEKTFSALAAQERAQRIATLVESHSAPTTRRNSLEDDFDDAYLPRRLSRPGGLPVHVADIPLASMDSRGPFDDPTFESDEDNLEKQKGKAKASSSSEAHKLVRAHTRKHRAEAWRMPAGPVSGQVTPDEEQAEEYVPRPQQYRGGVLSSLLKLYNAPPGTQSRRGSDASDTSTSMQSSGVTTPRTKARKWYNHKTHSQDTLAGLIEASAILGAQGGIQSPRKQGTSRPGMPKKSHSGKLIDSAMSRMTGKPRLEDEIRITIHIAETLSRQKYLLKLCRALMSYGAPTHRLEEYMKMSSRVLEIDGQFLYIPGCMIISFDDVTTHTTEVKLVRSTQGVDLGKLKDIHEIYKEVVHDIIGVEEATQRLDLIIKQKPKHNPWLLVIVYGFASATVAPFGKSLSTGRERPLIVASIPGPPDRHAYCIYARMLARFPPAHRRPKVRTI